MEPFATLLLVEDEDALRLPVAHLLRRRGYEVLEAADGEAALELLRRHAGRIDAVLLDLTLPGLSGAEVMSRAIRIWPDTRILITSAHSREASLDALAPAQVKAFLRKPYDLNELMRVLSEILPARTAAASHPIV